MSRLLRFLSLAFVALLGGCTAMMESSSYGSGDLYITNNRAAVTAELTARAEAQKAEAEARKAMWEARLAEAEYYAATGENYTSIVASDYESAYARRLYGFNSPTYRLPSSYYNLATSEAMRYASAYDPAFYNIMLSGDQVWVEPKYVTSMFGRWGATNVTFGIYSSPWVYGWGGYASPYYYSVWGYPHYSWYDWNWNMCYNPYHWGWGYNPHYYGHYHPHHHAPHPPQYRPGHISGGGNKYLTSERRNSSSRYTSPTSNQNYGKNLNGGRVGTSIRTGTTSSGINHSRVNGGVSGSGSRYTTTSGRSTTNSGTTSNSNYRGSSSSSSRGTVSNSSSNSSKSSNSSSNYRSSSSSSSRTSGSSSGSSSNFRSSGSSSSSRSSGGGGATSSRR